jgi:hypothetical protein
MRIFLPKRRTNQLITALRGIKGKKMNIELKIFSFWVICCILFYVIAKIGYNMQGRGGWNWKYYQKENWLAIVYNITFYTGITTWSIYLFVKFAFWFFNKNMFNP